MSASDSRIASVFAAVVDASAADRERLLQELCGDDAGLELTVRELLAASARAHTGALLGAAGLGSPTPLPPGARIGIYAIESVVAIGGMGIVYRARDTVLDTTVALKALKPEIAHDDRMRGTLREEARIAARLSGHPNIATVHAFVEQGGDAYIVSQFVEGETLRARVRRGPLTARESISILLEVLDALAAAHALGIVHRDLKPENVMCTPEGRAVVLDFGIALRQAPLPDRTTGTLHSPGTLGYMSPEQLRGQPVDGRSDVFAAGVLLYELLTARHPFGQCGSLSSFGAVLLDPPQPLTDDERRRLPGGLEPVVDLALAKRADDRFPSAAAMATALRAVRDARAPAVHAAPPTAATDEARRRSAVRWWAVHELAAGILYWLLLIPLWTVRHDIPQIEWRVLLFVLLGTLCIVPTLRLHLAFLLRVDAARAPTYHARYAPALRIGDAVFSLTLITTGALLVQPRPEWALLFVGFGLGSAVVAAAVEPHTAEEAIEALATPARIVPGDVDRGEGGGFGR